MRVIAGSARGTPLVAPGGTDTRPTQDKVKESLFNMLQGETAEAEVLDLFAGSGALGLEAISRGAARAVLVDRSREARQCICRNVEKLRFSQRVQTIFSDWEQAVERLRLEGRRFDLVFLDPPYRMEELGPLCDRLASLGLLAEGATLAWERRAGGSGELSSRFQLWKRRAYGDTEICIYRFCGEEESE